jgi:hypothetical protein
MTREFKGRLPRAVIARKEPAIYRGYELEQKALLVGWQIVILKNGGFVRNGSIMKDPDDARVEAHAYVDSLLAADA